jgi:hypothetical protein
VLISFHANRRGGSKKMKKKQFAKIEIQYGFKSHAPDAAAAQEPVLFFQRMGRSRSPQSR